MKKNPKEMSEYKVRVTKSILAKCISGKKNRQELINEWWKLFRFESETVPTTKFGEELFRFSKEKGWNPDMSSLDNWVEYIRDISIITNAVNTVELEQKANNEWKLMDFIHTRIEMLKKYKIKAENTKQEIEWINSGRVQQLIEELKKEEPEKLVNEFLENLKLKDVPDTRSWIKRLLDGKNGKKEEYPSKARMRIAKEIDEFDEEIRNRYKGNEIFEYYFLKRKNNRDIPQTYKNTGYSTIYDTLSIMENTSMMNLTGTLNSCESSIDSLNYIIGKYIPCSKNTESNDNDLNSKKNGQEKQIIMSDQFIERVDRGQNEYKKIVEMINSIERNPDSIMKMFDDENVAEKDILMYVLYLIHTGDLERIETLKNSIQNYEQEKNRQRNRLKQNKQADSR